MSAGTEVAGRALIALTSHAQLGDTGKGTGFYLPEAAHPWAVFGEAGFGVDLVSIQGGRPPMVGEDAGDPVQRAFLEDDEMSAKLAATLTPDEVNPFDYDVILYAGGHGTMWDFPDDDGLAGIARDIYEAGGVIAAVCHGPAGLVNLRLSDGRYLVDGKRVSAFTNDEEQAVGLATVVPFLLATSLEARGAKHEGVPNFEPFVVTDGRLVTGQNPSSAAGVARASVLALEAGRTRTQV